MRGLLYSQRRFECSKNNKKKTEISVGSLKHDDSFTANSSALLHTVYLFSHDAPVVLWTSAEHVEVCLPAAVNCEVSPHNQSECPAQGFQTAPSGYISTLSVILVQNMSGVAAADHMTGTVVSVTLQELCDSNTCSRPRLYCCSSSTLPPLAQLRLQRSGKIRLLFCTVHSWPAVNNYVNWWVAAYY